MKRRGVIIGLGPGVSEPGRHPALRGRRKNSALFSGWQRGISSAFGGVSRNKPVDDNRFFFFTRVQFPPSPLLRSLSAALRSSFATQHEELRSAQHCYKIKRRSVLRSLVRSRAFLYISNMYYVYILQSQKDGSYYVGFTTNLKKRIQEHNWHLSKYSKTKAPFELIWFCGFKNKKKSLDFEEYLKQGSGFAFRNRHLI